jgi:hypothetical protein
MFLYIFFLQDMCLQDLRLQIETLKKKKEQRLY